MNTEADEEDTPAGAALSLREAVRDAASGDIIRFAAALSGRALPLTRGEMTVTGRTLTVDGSTLANGLTLTANLTSRHFNVAATGTLTLTGLTLARGLSGAVLNAGTTTLTNCIVRECRTVGIHNTGTFTATGTKFLFNEAEHGLHGTQGTSVTTTNPSNYPPPGAGGNGTAGADGGAIRSTGPLIISNCWFHGNKGGTGGHGGLGGRVFYEPGFGGSQILLNGLRPARIPRPPPGNCLLHALADPGRLSLYSRGIHHPPATLAAQLPNHHRGCQRSRLLSPAHRRQPAFLPTRNHHRSLRARRRKIGRCWSRVPRYLPAPSAPNGVEAKSCHSRGAPSQWTHENRQAQGSEFHLRPARGAARRGDRAGLIRGPAGAAP